MKIDNLFIVAICCLFMFSCERGANNKEKAVYPAEMLDELKLPSNKSNKIIVFVAPGCEYCSYQTGALLSKNEKKPESVQIIFLADMHLDSLLEYSKRYSYSGQQAFFLRDKNKKLAKFMGVNTYPTMFLYDTAGVHLQTIVGEAKPSYVYKFFHDTE